MFSDLHQCQSYVVEMFNDIEQSYNFKFLPNGESFCTGLNNFRMGAGSNVDADDGRSVFLKDAKEPLFFLFRVSLSGTANIQNRLAVDMVKDFLESSLWKVHVHSVGQHNLYKRFRRCQ